MTRIRVDPRIEHGKLAKLSVDICGARSASHNLPCIFPCYSQRTEKSSSGHTALVTNSDLQFGAEVEVSDQETETEGRRA